jgi:hypothetical protein
MRSIVEGSNSADAISPLDGGAGILFLRSGWMLRSGLSTDTNLLFCLFFFPSPYSEKGSEPTTAMASATLSQVPQPLNMAVDAIWVINLP